MCKLTYFHFFNLTVLLEYINLGRRGGFFVWAVQSRNGSSHETLRNSPGSTGHCVIIYLSLLVSYSYFIFFLVFKKVVRLLPHLLHLL